MPAKLPVKILLIDGNAVFVESVRLFLDMWPDALLLAHTDNGRMALDLCVSLQPDLVLVDVALASMDCAEMVRRLRVPAGAPHVALLALHDSDEHERLARELGTLGLINKADFVLALYPMVKLLAAEGG